MSSKLLRLPIEKSTNIVTHAIPSETASADDFSSAGGSSASDVDDKDGSSRWSDDNRGHGDVRLSVLSSVVPAVLSPAGKSFTPDLDRRPNLLIDIQAKLQEGKGAGYERFAKLHNLKQMAATLIYLQERGIDDYVELRYKASAASDRFNSLSDRIKKLDVRLADNAALQKQIVIYSKTRKTYVAYRKAGYSKKFKSQHEADIILHQAAKKYFDDLGYGDDNRLPTVAALRSDYAVMLEEKKQCYRDYRQAKANVDCLYQLKNVANVNERL